MPAGELVLELFGVELGVMDRPLALNRTICVYFFFIYSDGWMDGWMDGFKSKLN